MGESRGTRLMRWVFNCWPCVAASGGRVTYIAADFREIRLRLPLSWRTRNLVGTLFGGSMFAAVDPFYMVMLIKLLGPQYAVWDKACSVQFRRPGREALYARFLIDDAELAAIRAALEEQTAIERTYAVDLTNAEGVLHARVEKLIHIRRLDAPRRAGGVFGQVQRLLWSI